MFMLGSRKHSLSKRKAEPPRARLGRCWLVGIALCLANILGFEKAHSVSAYKTTYYKQYAFMQLDYSFTEFYCLDDLYTAESRWNPKAKNGSHYGIPQGRSKYLATVDGFKQIEWGIKYNMNRYGSMCKALHHFKTKGWH